MKPDPVNTLLPRDAVVTSRIQESPSIFSLGIRFTDPSYNEIYTFEPGQFNMLYLYGVGEIPISIVSDPHYSDELVHTIRTVGRVTQEMSELQPGDHLGVRGPYGQGWPLQQARHRDVLIITGGLGCAPSVSAINYIMLRRQDFGRVCIIQGVKHSDDLIWQQQYEKWMQMKNTQVLLAADVAEHHWSWHVGLVTELIPRIELDISHAVIMLCGPEMMMQASALKAIEQGSSAKQIWLSMERNMSCAIGHCGHCQFGADFICKSGPVLNYQCIAERMKIRGL